mmetsp:Transcript_28334/g.95170  ORF Transcript_28334/g.95170 Transcript_28334/m.95170 type:complete len:207 (-) Transcript_28334:1293-1913(-)
MPLLRDDAPASPLPLAAPTCPCPACPPWALLPSCALPPLWLPPPWWWLPLPGSWAQYSPRSAARLKARLMYCSSTGRIGCSPSTDQPLREEHEPTCGRTPRHTHEARAAARPSADALAQQTPSHSPRAAGAWDARTAGGTLARRVGRMRLARGTVLLHFMMRCRSSTCTGVHTAARPESASPPLAVPPRLAAAAGAAWRVLRLAAL